MVFTIAQTTAFFEAADQMGIPGDTRVQLGEEGIEAVSDLSDLDKDTLTQVADCWGVFSPEHPRRTDRTLCRDLKGSTGDLNVHQRGI